MHAVMGRAYTAAMASIPSSNPARGAPRSLTGLLPFLRPYRIHILLSGVFLVLAALALGVAELRGRQPPNANISALS